METHKYNTRGAENLRIPKIKTSIWETFITFTGVKIWNELKSKIDISQKISTFKQKTISFLIEKYED
jgi:hypothetical protein